MYDIIVVGSGVAGSYLAERLKKYNVLVIEKDKKIRVKDSGIVSSRIFEFFKGNKLIKEKIDKIKFVSANNSLTIEKEKPFVYILERNELAEFLRDKIEDKTVFERAKEVQKFDGFITVKTDKHEYRTKLLVGADGANSIVRKSITDKEPKICVGVMNRTNEIINHDCIHVFLNKYFSPDFFAWAIPQNNEYGLITAIRPLEYYNYFKKKLNMPNGTVYARPIPIGTTKSYANRILLIGDACGLVKPITGGGIIFSLKSAEFAAETIKDAFEQDKFDEDNLKYYEWAWEREFGSEIKKQLFFRKLYRKMTNRQVDEMLNKFGTSIQGLDEFDYDMLSKSWRKMPKLRLLRFLLGIYFDRL